VCSSVSVEETEGRIQNFPFSSQDTPMERFTLAGEGQALKLLLMPTVAEADAEVVNSMEMAAEGVAVSEQEK